MEIPDQEKQAFRVETGYVIIQGSDPNDLSKKVAQAMAEGWGLCGGPFVLNIQTPALKDIMAATMQTVWMQAVYKIVQIPLSPEETERLRRENSPIIT
jgi:hypothetical protein